MASHLRHWNTSPDNEIDCSSAITTVNNKNTTQGVINYYTYHKDRLRSERLRAE